MSAALFRVAHEWMEDGHQVALATVCQVKGSVPRHQGAKMLLRADGTQWGTIGGGQVEYQVQQEMLSALSEGTARVKTYHLVRDLAMCCGGSMTVFIEPLNEREHLIKTIAEMLTKRTAVSIRTSLTDKTLDGSTKALPWNGEEWGEYIPPRERVFLFGLGHVARACGPLLKRIGFDVIVCDDNETDAMTNLPDWACEEVVSFELSDIEKKVGPVGEHDWFIVMTRDHAIDQRILEQALTRPLRYVGVIGSRGKAERFRKRLEAKGLGEQWVRVSCPIGLTIGAETPDEIGVSLAAELIAKRRNTAI